MSIFGDDSGNNDDDDVDDVDGTETAIFPTKSN